MNPCKTCPFIASSKNYGAPDWVADVCGLFAKGSTSHSCHCTDQNADGYIGGKVRQCDGIKMLKANHEAGFKMYPKAYRNYGEFLSAQMAALKVEGILE